MEEAAARLFRYSCAPAGQYKHFLSLIRGVVSVVGVPVRLKVSIITVLLGRGKKGLRSCQTPFDVSDF
jgi:hypothetical protein